MKQIIETTFFDRALTRGSKGTDLPSDAYSEMCARWPQFVAPSGQHGFNLHVGFGSELQKQILDFLESYGRTPLWSRSAWPESSSQFQLLGRNEFEKEDFDRSRYFRLTLKNEIAADGGYADEQWNVWVRSARIQTKVALGAVPNGGLSGGVFLVNETMRKQLLDQRFKDVILRPVELVGESPKARPLWQVWTDRAIPRLLSAMKDVDGLPYDLLTGKAQTTHDFYSPCLLRCTRNELEAQADFDFALSPEPMGRGRAAKPLMFVSKRVYEWCSDQRVVDGWIPLIEE